jgi:hypothetical protein
MIDWLEWLKRLEFATVGSLAIAGLCLMIGQSAERYADAKTAAVALQAAREASADGRSAAHFSGIDYSATGSIKQPVGAASPCRLGD